MLRAHVQVLFFHFVLALFLLVLLMPYNCVLGCTESYAREPNLRRHQSTCSLAQAQREAIRKLRGSEGHKNLNEQALSSFDDRKNRIYSRHGRHRHKQQAATAGPICDLQEMDVDDSHPSQDPPISSPVFTRSSHPRQGCAAPRPVQNLQPESLAPLQSPHLALAGPSSVVSACLSSVANAFGIWREYSRRPTFDPDAALEAPDFQASHITEVVADLEPTVPAPISNSARPSYWPYLNSTIHGIMKWLNNGNSLKSEGQVNKLVHDVILSPNFRAEDLVGFDANRENQRLDNAISANSLRSQFKETSVSFEVPSGDRAVPPCPFNVPGFLHRNITSVIRDAFMSPLAHLYRFTPFHLFHSSPFTNQPERVYGEIYTSDAFFEETENVQRHSPVPDDSNCTREKVVAALMVASDETHLTDFGNAKAWPIYLMLGNLSKYIRSQPNSGAMHHLAYIPSLPASFKNFAALFHCKWATQHRQIMTHCRRELMHAIWEKILDAEFIHAYTYGIVIECIDGIERRIYPRFFTYSADYPEKVLLATIRDKGLCPCPRCLVPKTHLDRLGLKLDIRNRLTQFRHYMADKVKAARRLIYQDARPITGTNVEAFLKSFSGVPTENAFVKKLGADFNPSNMLVVDLMHEFELGVWKTLFTHLIRLLYAAGNGSDKFVVELDNRYRQISTFGHGTIRKFAANSSEMKKLAARDFEDLLQCAIPAFEGLLPAPHNKRLMKLLYRTAEWHALAKLRMHTDSTLTLLEELTTEFGKLMRQFRDLTCSQFATIELPREAAARTRVQTSKSGQTGTQANTSGSSTRKPRPLNILTVKFHFLGDYVQHIRLFGTSDSYSTQLSELAHCLVKRFYSLTNKKNATKQIGQKVTRREVLTKAEQQEVVEAASQRQSFEDHHFISESRNQPLSLYDFVQQNNGDPTIKEFMPKLKDHLLGRLHNHKFDGDDHNFSEQERNTIRIQNNTIYQHATVRINYTTYDLRRDYDTVNPRTHPFVMLHAPEEIPTNSHPFWYAAVLGIYHAYVQHIGPNAGSFRPKKMEFLLVRWLGLVPQHSFGRRAAKLPQIGFVPETDDYAFSFLDPSLIIRGCHLLPSFVDGRTSNLLSVADRTLARPNGEEDDWVAYNIGIFVDRDIFMRYLGLGIGHTIMGKPAIDDVDEKEAIEPGTRPLDDDWSNQSREQGNPEAFEQDMDGMEEEEEEADFDEDELEEEDDGYSDTDLGYDDL